MLKIETVYWRASLRFNNRTLCFLTALCSALSLCSSRLAADEAFDQADFFSEVPIVSSATRLNQKITEVPAAITIIDREMIEASGATEIPQLLRLVPGYISYYVFGNQFGVTNRGLTLEFPGDLEVMIDGRSVYEPIFSTVEWSSLGISVEDIEYIEVLRGSNTPAYGSNAYLGAINIVTTHAVQKKQGTALTLTVGDIKTRNSRLRHSGSVGALHYSLGLSYRSNEGFPRLKHSDEPSNFDRIKDGNEAQHINLKLVYTPSVFDTFELHAGFGESELNIPGDDLGDDPKGFNNRLFESSYQLLKWQRNLENFQEVQLQFHHNRLEIDEERKLGPLSELLGIPPAYIPLLFDGHPDEEIITGVRDTVSERYDLELQHRLRMKENQQLVWGAGVRYDKLESEFLLTRDDPVDIFSYRLFANWELHPFADWTVNLGAMAEHNNIVGNFISPRAAVNFQLSPTQVIRASYTYGNRTPSILESHQVQGVHFADGTLIDANINFEDDISESKVHELELGYLQSWADDRWNLDLRLFRSETDAVIGEIIVPFPDLDEHIATVSNTMEWINEGFDTQIRWRPDARSLVSLQYAYTYFDGRRLKRLEPREVRNLHRELPRHNANLLVSRNFKDGWSASFVFYYVSKVAWRQGDIIKNQDRLDLRIAKTFNWGKAETKAELIVHNLLNDYPEFDDFNVFDTRVFFRISLALP